MVLSRVFTADVRLGHLALQGQQAFAAKCGKPAIGLSKPLM